MRGVWLALGRRGGAETWVIGKEPARRHRLERPQLDKRWSVEEGRGTVDRRAAGGMAIRADAVDWTYASRLDRRGCKDGWPRALGRPTTVRGDLACREALPRARHLLS
jgi:hypothetical protein